MTYYYTTGGSGWVMIPCMVSLLAEVKACSDSPEFPDFKVINSGQLGDARHQAEPTSRHNPALGPDGVWYVCAADFSGTGYSKLADFHQALYKAHDPRVYNHGFAQWGNGYGTEWYTGDKEWTGRDIGHCHFDVTMAYPNLSKLWYVGMSALWSTKSWGLAEFLRSGKLNTQSGPVTPIDPTKEIDVLSPQDNAKLDGIVAALQGIAAAVREIRADTNSLWSRLDAITPGSSKYPRSGFYLKDPSAPDGVVGVDRDKDGKLPPNAQLNGLADRIDVNVAIDRLADKIDAVIAALAAK